VSFRSTQGEAVRGTIVNLRRKSLVLEIYNPTFILQVSEVLNEVTVRMGTRNAYSGKAVVVSLVNTGLTSMLSVTLIDEWRELSDGWQEPAAVRAQARQYVRDWDERFRIGRDYQIVINETRAFLADVARWVEQVDMTDSLPKEDGKLRNDYFDELAAPFVEKIGEHMICIEGVAAAVDADSAPAHCAFAQAALHPLLLRAPFIYRAYSKPLGYAGDFMMVNQILSDPRQGPSTYFQIVNTAFLQAPVAVAHRNRIDILVTMLGELADSARQRGRPMHVLNVACGPAAEIQRFLQTYPEPEWLSFELLDFSEEALDWTRQQLMAITAKRGRPVKITYTHDSVHALLKRRSGSLGAEPAFDAVYCAGLFDYLSDKVCKRLTAQFAMRLHPGGMLFITNVHSNNPGRHGMEHVLDWHLIYRDEAGIEALLPPPAQSRRIFVDATGVNVFAQASLP
jgi:extracellular factor (EF) 3-hydroxypalmitic acid methyl ester biosynthesis protein